MRPWLALEDLLGGSTRDASKKGRARALSVTVPHRVSSRIRKD